MAKRPAVALYSEAHDKSKQTVRQWLSKQWILHDPGHKDADSGKPLFRRPNGKSTDDPTDAQLFPSKGDAKKVGDLGPDNWVPKPLTDFWPPKK